MSWQAKVRLKVGQDNSWTNFAHSSGLVCLESDGVPWPMEVVGLFVSNIGEDTTYAGMHDA
jgi:hypothetical protein